MHRCPVAIPEFLPVTAVINVIIEHMLIMQSLFIEVSILLHYSHDTLSLLLLNVTVEPSILLGLCHY